MLYFVCLLSVCLFNCVFFVYHNMVNKDEYICDLGSPSGGDYDVVTDDLVVRLVQSAWCVFVCI